jgi:hypothetical protein
MDNNSENQKILNQISFIKYQMEDLNDKLAKLRLYENYVHLESVIESYSDFMIKTTRELIKIEGDNNE